MRITLLLLFFLAACGFDLGASESKLRTGTALGGNSTRYADYDERRVSAYNTIAVDETHIYWTETYAVMRVSRNGGEPEVLTDRLFAPSAIAVDDSAIYVAAQELDAALPELRFARWPGVIVRLPKNGGELELLADEQADPFALVATADHVYWMNSWSEETSNTAIGQATVQRLPKRGGPVETIADHQDLADGLTVADARVYWTSADANGDWLFHRRLFRADGARPVDVTRGEDLGIHTVRFLDGLPIYVDRDGRLVQIEKDGAVRALSDAIDQAGDVVELGGGAVITVSNRAAGVPTGELDERGQQVQEVIAESADLVIHRDGKAAILATWRPGRANAFLEDIAVDGDDVFLLVDGGVERVSLTLEK